ncbi:hypothetical protein Pint_01515 [Pistacia integerrima]|uniref:Uncharacterized protein n=1 Tax=Pistacia integerrima TaxID=434235 RepID=A0ACC0ZKV7_9ROSI|nr:hypothetical protein Pint_01515 [Pistacia integerrima]
MTNLPPKVLDTPWLWFIIYYLYSQNRTRWINVSFFFYHETQVMKLHFFSIAI